MGILVTRDEENTKLGEQINADLRSKLNSTSNLDPNDKDFAEDSTYLKDTATTGRFSWVWIVLVVLAIISLVLIILI